MLTSDAPTDASVYQCFDCRTPLSLRSQDLLVCPSCSKSWPIIEGIPRFYTPPYYWGEMPLAQAEQMILDARSNGWRQAVARMFADYRDMEISITDWQRGSWLPLIPLPSDAIALDIGSGNGALTHVVARAASTVYSLEAVPQRIAFTRVRLEQEGIANVRLVQASALQLPFGDEMFDLIVVNGILEWVGAWVDQGDPREIQIEFLKNLRRMLKPSGHIMIGIENRIGYSCMRGTIDHSGLPYTSLMPRWFASFYMRHRHFKKYLLEKERRDVQYRTYTYSENGYLKLLAESGLKSGAMYWADPGYNQPYNLIPLENSLPSRYLSRKRHEPMATAKRGWKVLVKRAAAAFGPLNRALCSEFVIFAGRNEKQQLTALWDTLRRQLPDLPDVKQPLLALETKAYGPKNVIHVFEAGAPEMRCVLRTTTPGTVGVDEFVQCYQNLSAASDRSLKDTNAGFSTPRPLGRVKIGWFHYSAESVVEGMSIAKRAFESRVPANVLKAELPRAIEAAVRLAVMFRGEMQAIAVDPARRKIPAEVESDTDVRNALQEFSRRTDSEWVQHGDFTIENVFTGGPLPAIIDWEHMARGGPALYDVFSLLISALPGVPLNGWPRSAGQWIVQFEGAFFGRSEWSRLYAQWMKNAAGALGIPASDIPSQFLEFLLQRYHIMNERDGVQGRFHAEFLRIAVREKDKFVCAPNA